MCAFWNYRCGWFNRWLFSIACPGKHDAWTVLNFMDELQYGDWLFLYYITKNVDNFLASLVLEELGDDNVPDNFKIFCSCNKYKGAFKKQRGQKKETTEIARANSVDACIRSRRISEIWRDIRGWICENL